MIVEKGVNGQDFLGYKGNENRYILCGSFINLPSQTKRRYSVSDHTFGLKQDFIREKRNRNIEKLLNDGI